MSEYHQTGHTYDVVNTKRDYVDQVHLKEKNEYDEIQESNRCFPIDKSFTTSIHNIQDQQKVTGAKYKSSEASGVWGRLEIDSNPSYGTVPNMPVGEYSLAGPTYDKVNKTSNSDNSLKLKHEYAEVQESKRDPAEDRVQDQNRSRYEVAM